MTDSIIKTNSEYTHWLKGIKQSFLQTQLKAAISVNTSLLEFYWQLGGEIIEKQKNAQWGDGFLSQLSQDLIAEFPDVKGFSRRNLWAIRQWFLFYSGDAAIVQQPVAQLAQIPWGHNIVIIQKCQSRAEAWFYALCDINKPIGISAYQLTQALPENLKSSLPSIEEIEAEFAKAR